MGTGMGMGQQLVAGVIYTILLAPLLLPPVDKEQSRHNTFCLLSINVPPLFNLPFR